MTWVRTTIDGFTVGDRIRFTDEEYDRRVEATITQAEAGALLTDHRDGWYVWGNRDQGQLYCWVDDTPAVVEGHWGTAVPANTIPPGTRVRHTGPPPFEGTLVRIAPIRGYTYAQIARDDDRTGSGPNGEWCLMPTTPFEPWVGEPAPAVEVVAWQAVTFGQLRVGDVVRLTDHGEHFQGTVTFIGRHNNIGQHGMTVRRDDGQRGGGLDRGWFVAPDHITNLERQGEPLTPEQLADLPMRAVFCACCGYGTGEFTNTAPTEPYCIQCRALPALWEYGGAWPGGLINDGAHPLHNGQRHTRMQNIGALEGIPAAATATAGLTPLMDDPFDDEDDPQEEEDQPGYRCTYCDGTQFQLRNLQLAHADIHTNTRDGWDYCEGDMINFYAEQDGGDLVTGDAWVECTDCERRQDHIPFTVDW
jgi:hypothetical protein